MRKSMMTAMHMVYYTYVKSGVNDLVNGAACSRLYSMHNEPIRQSGCQQAEHQQTSVSDNEKAIRQLVSRYSGNLPAAL